MMYEHIDLTLLKPYASNLHFINLMKSAKEYNCKSVCVPSSMVSFCEEYMNFEHINNVLICTVIGFPNGDSPTVAKLAEANDAILHGAKEIDMVINLHDVKNFHYNKIEKEIKAIRNLCHENNVILKVIVETCYLNEKDKEILCNMLIDLNVDYIKTSTGFGTDGAKIEDVKLFSDIIKNRNSNLKIKASGGIRTKEQVEEFLKYCDRIGMSKLPE